MSKKALIAMSGGVDSSVAALLMKERGFECVGCTMMLHENAEADNAENSTRCSPGDAADAARVAELLEIPFYVYDYRKAFYDNVVRRFVKRYQEGMTPNPCVDCNRSMKFGVLLRKAEQLDCDVLVTGHYARIVESDGAYYLKKGLDVRKDQSYVLYGIARDDLKRIMFPCGEYTKEAIRTLAVENKLVTADKPDSQDICFVPDGNYAGTVEAYSGMTPEKGNFVDRNGKVLGTHNGIIHYTIGQHRGLGLGTYKKQYVCAINPEDNTVTLGDMDDLFSTETMVSEFNWTAGSVPQHAFRCNVMTRYRRPEQPATVTPIGDDKVKVLFDVPQRAVTPGQSAVFYDGDTVIGGGTIDRD